MLKCSINLVALKSHKNLNKLFSIRTKASCSNVVMCFAVCLAAVPLVSDVVLDASRHLNDCGGQPRLHRR